MAETGGMTPEEVRSFLTGENPGLASQRRTFMRVPSDPRCKLCAAPFAGVGGLLFTDVRGSTAMGERLRPTEFHAFLDHFYRLATDAIVRHDGVVDKIVGDE